MQGLAGVWGWERALFMLASLLETEDVVTLILASEQLLGIQAYPLRGFVSQFQAMLSP